MRIPEPKKLIGWLNVKVIAYWAVIVLIGWSFGRGPNKKDVLEALAHLGLFLILWNTPALKGFWLNADSSRRLLLAGVLGLMLAGQTINNYRISYPFPHWSMYTDPFPSKRYTEYKAEFASGRHSHFPFRDLSPTMSPRGFMSRFTNIVNSVENPRSPSAKEAAALDSLGRDLRRMILLYNKRNRGDPIVGILVSRHTIHVGFYHGKQSIDSLMLLKVGVD